MRVNRLLALAFVLLSLGTVRLLPWQDGMSQVAYAATATPDVAVGPQYDTTHVYVAPENFNRFVASLLATFGGTTSKQGVFTVTPTASSTMSQLVLTPAGTISVFGFRTPIPYPFGIERTGYLVTNLDGATQAARADGANVLVSPFDDPIGRDAIIQWPGGVNKPSPDRGVAHGPSQGGSNGDLRGRLRGKRSRCGVQKDFVDRR